MYMCVYTCIFFYYSVRNTYTILSLALACLGYLLYVFLYYIYSAVTIRLFQTRFDSIRYICKKSRFDLISIILVKKKFNVKVGKAIVNYNF